MKITCALYIPRSSPRFLSLCLFICFYTRHFDGAMKFSAKRAHELHVRGHKQQKKRWQEKRVKSVHDGSI